MDIFPKIAKTLLYTIIIVVVYIFVIDFGKSFVIESHNSFIASNAATYVSKFALSQHDLSDFKGKAITSSEIENSIVNYFRLMYDDVGGYTQTSYTSSGDSFKIIYTPDSTKINEQGIIIVRGKLEGFDGTTAHNLPKGVGRTTINIEQKQPSGLRKMILSSGNYKVMPDNDGMHGYYSVVVTKAFTLNTLKEYNK